MLSKTADGHTTAPTTATLLQVVTQVSASAFTGLSNSISCLNKSITILVKDVPVFQVLVDKLLEILLKVAFALSSLDMQPTVVSMAVCHTLAVWAKHIVSNPESVLMDPLVLHKLKLLPVALCCCVCGLVDSLPQKFYLLFL